jgi:Fe-S-cluster-containing dehydrogenase component/DMSO reductase anchor subunit
MTRSGQHGTPEAEVVTLIDTLLAEQRQLTAVEAFARRHSQPAAPGPAPRYRDLIPLTAPRPGEQYAFEVDLDRCSGCKGCVSACHSLNGLDEDESWREVGFLVGEAVVPLSAVAGEKLGTRKSKQATVSSAHLPTFSLAKGSKVIPLQQTVTTACHHCVEPGCLLGCPVLAYDKDPATGIVRHLDDQCIGCSYCILKCPYEVPKYSAKRGIVRKCDMCHGRLAEGEAPACVQACPNEAIRIALVKPAEVTAQIQKSEVGSRNETTTSDFALPGSDFNGWLPDSPDPAITLPTTRYLTRQPNSTLRAADHGRFKPQAAHWPLVWMLLLTQMGVGLWVSAAAVQAHLPPSVRLPLLLTAWTVLHAGLGASVFHLGQPLRAWRAFLGWRTSWMSREIIVFGGLSVLATATVTVELARAAGRWPLALNPALLVPLTAGIGLLAVFTSAMIYVDTRRPCWRAQETFIRFFGQVFLLGAAGAAGVIGWCHWLRGEAPGAAPAFAGIAFVVRTALFLWDRQLRRVAGADPEHPAHRSVRAMETLYPKILRVRLWLFVVSTLAGALAIVGFAGLGPVWATASFASTFAASVLKRFLFFVAGVAPKMPGMP